MRKPLVKFRWLTDCESGAEASNFEKYFEEEEEQQQQQKLKHRLQQVADYQPGDRLKEGTQIFILLNLICV
jgi:putative component of toxin-antitoxin plasmid stabilization module